jgi:DNA mismatch repair ATPase MutS
MEELIETVSQDLDIPRKEIKLDETNDGMAFRVTNRHDKILNKNKQYQRLGTTKTAITFTSPSLQRYSDKWAEKMEEYEAHAKVIIQKMVSIVFG